MNRYCNTKGTHCMLDLQYDPVKTNLNTSYLMELCYRYMGESITENSSMKIVDKVHHLFEEPPGFTIIYCLDESHCSCHSYTNQGLLSFDCYTCGNSNPVKIMEEIEKKLQVKVAGLRPTFSHVVKRFHYYE